MNKTPALSLLGIFSAAGLIFTMVFVALPSAQRSQRDTQRTNDAAKLVSTLERWASNHGLNYPEQGSLTSQWLKDEIGDYFIDPGGPQYVVVNEADEEMSPPKIFYGVGHKCSSDGLRAEKLEQKSPRKIVVIFGLEDGQVCYDNA